MAKMQGLNGYRTDGKTLVKLTKMDGPFRNLQVKRLF
jgi:hypothetical protein